MDNKRSSILLCYVILELFLQLAFFHCTYYSDFVLIVLCSFISNNNINNTRVLWNCCYID